jgi:hypothetical protein
MSLGFGKRYDGIEPPLGTLAVEWNSHGYELRRYLSAGEFEVLLVSDQRWPSGFTALHKVRAWAISTGLAPRPPKALADTVEFGGPNGS